MAGAPELRQINWQDRVPRPSGPVSRSRRRSPGRARPPGSGRSSSRRAPAGATTAKGERYLEACIGNLADFDPAKRYPVAFLIHGGPQGSFGNDFHYRWNPQVYAGAGYGAVMVDFHGSTGYGQDFTDSISGAHGVVRGDTGGPIETGLTGTGQVTLYPGSPAGLNFFCRAWRSR